MSKKFWITISIIATLWGIFSTVAFWDQAITIKQIRAINAELYRDGVLKNDYIARLQKEIRDTRSLVDRVMIDNGMLVFDENGKEIR